MSTPTVTQQLPAPIVGKFNLALTESKFQQLADEAATLVFNEDNIPKIKEFLDKTRGVEKAIESTHKAGKEEALTIGRQWDAGKNTFLATVAGIKSIPQQKYTELCQQVEKRRIEQANEKARIESIKNGIESNAILFAKQIADCETSIQLTAIESKINLEKTRKEKYQEFLEDATKRYTELNVALANQKKVVKQLEENARQQELAKKEQDDAKLLQLKQQQEQQQVQIEENKITVQETAIAQSVNAPVVETAQEVLPAVKPRRSTWKWEVINAKETARKMPDWTQVTIVESKVDDYLKAKKAEGIDGEEFVTAGIRFYLDKTF